MQFTNGLTRILVLFLAAMGIQAQAIAAMFNVTDATGLRSALLTAATNGQDDVIVLAGGTYATSGATFTFVTNETYSLTLRGANGTTRDQVLLDGGGTSQVLNFGCVGSCGAITLQGLTVQNGNVTGHGGGVTVSTSLILSDVSLSGNRAAVAGAINVGGSATVADSSFTNNTATGYGGAIYATDVTVSNSTFSNNTAGAWGGAIYGAGTVTNSTFSNNTATIGGAIYGAGTVTNSSFSNNTAKGHGGAIRIVGSATVTDSSFTNNAASQDGGAIYATNVTVSKSTFNGNAAGGSGGAIQGSWNVTNSLFSRNTALNGGAMFGVGIIVNNTFYANTLTSAGYGSALSVFPPGGSITVINAVFYGHTTPAIYAESPYNLYNNLIDTNTGIAGATPLMAGNVAPGAMSPFVDAANGNFRLAAGSIAIDAGLDLNSTTLANLVGSSVAAIRAALLTDLDGNPRPKPGTVVDIGTYEFGSVALDTQAPTVPSALTATAVSASQINLAWTASIDNVGVTQYNIYRTIYNNCVPLPGTVCAAWVSQTVLLTTLTGTPPATSYSDVGLSPSTRYDYTVQACDVANNCSAQSTAASAMTPSSTAPTPTCTLAASPNSITAGSTSTLTASCTPAATSYLWAANTGLGSTVSIGIVSPTVTTTYTVAGVNSAGTGATATATVTVTPNGALLTVTNSGSGYGNVTSNPSGISCYAPVPGHAYLVAPDCAESYASGTGVTLTATPSSGSTFAGWSGACTGTGTCTVTVDAAKNVTTTFNLAFAGVNQWTRVATGTGIQIAPFPRVVVDPRNDAVIYVETTNGVYKSTDSGVTWNRKSTGLPQGVVSQLVVSPSDSSILFVLVNQITATTSQTKLYRSADAGESWVVTDLNVASSGDTGMPVIPDPSNGSIYYAYCSLSNASLCKSIDGGLTWTGLSGARIFGDLAIIGSNPQIILIMGAPQNLSRSVDGGATWTTSGTSGLPSYSGNSRLIATPNGFFAGIPSFGVYRSSDGIAWFPANGGIETKTVVEIVAGPAGLYAVVQEHDLYLSTNLGISWTKIGPLPATASHLALSNQNSQRLFLGDSAAGYQSSANGGSSWTNVTSNNLLPQDAVSNILLSADGITIFAGNRPAGTQRASYANGWRSNDAGLSWSSSRYVFNINPDQLHVYGAASSYSSCFARSSDLGVTWLERASQPCLTGNPGKIVFDAVSTQQPETIFLLINRCSSFGFSFCTASVAETTDGGSTWQDQSTGIPYAGGNVLKLDPRHTDILYLGTVAGVSKTVNGGGLWVSSNVGLPTNIYYSQQDKVQGVISLSISPHDSDVLYAGYSCDSSSPVTCYGVYKSINGGNSWSAVNNGLPTGFAVTSILVDPVNPERVYLATRGGGVFITNDGGTNWAPFNTGLDDLMVNVVAVDRSGLKLYAGTDSGIFSFTGSGSTIPDPPAITGVVAASGSVIISFTAPPRDGGSPITSYTATCTAAGKSPLSVAGTSSPITLQGLTGGVIYSCSVTASNRIGTSPSSATVQAGTNISTGSPVYRFFNMNAGGHFYTIDEAERNTVIQNYKWFRDEQIGFHANSVQQPSTLPIYRFFNNNAGGHFYTIDEAERNTVIQHYKWFRDEGIGFYAYPTQQPGTLPVYRFFNTNAGGHFYTIDEAEKNTVIQHYKWFRYEGIGFYAYPSP